MTADYAVFVKDDWPAPVEVLNEGGMSDIVLLCEHASAHIPAEYDGLGLSVADRQRHIAWDIGAATVTRHLSRLIDAPAFLAGYSRLLIDLNRPLDAASSIVTCSEATDVPGNHRVDVAEINRRRSRIFIPYHTRVSRHLDGREGRATRIVCVHSFTPVFLGQARKWHAGVLYGEASGFGEAVLDRLRAPGREVGANVPYATSRTEDYSVPIHGDDRSIPAILVEIRQDLIGDAVSASGWADTLAKALQAI